MTTDEPTRQPGAGANSARLFGYDFESLTTQSLLECIERSVSTKQRCWVATVNVQLLCIAERDPRFRDVLSRANVIIADGMPIVWLSHLMGPPLQERVTGSDLLLPLAEKAAAEGWRLFFCGGQPGVPEEVAELLCARFPGLKVVGTASPHFADRGALTDPACNQELLASIRSAEPDVLLVAFGAPKQERWIEHHLLSGQVDAPVAIGIGGSFDFLVGRQRRAPRWMRRSGLEWVFRMLTQPRRLTPRYMGDLFTFARLCVSELRARRSRDPGGPR